MRRMIREPATENTYNKPPNGARCTPISNKLELIAVVVISQTYVMAEFDVRWKSLNE